MGRFRPIPSPTIPAAGPGRLDTRQKTIVNRFPANSVPEFGQD